MAGAGHRAAGAGAPPLRRQRAAECLRRYAPAELVALIGALAGNFLLEVATRNHEAATCGAAIGGNVGYYGMLVARDVRCANRAAGSQLPCHRLRVAVRSLRALAVQLGPAEALDTAIVRPACTTIATAALGPAVGVLVAKLVADLAFYVPVLTSYELRRRRRGRPGSGSVAALLDPPRTVRAPGAAGGASPTP
jgi:hypothetical protein